MRRFLTLLLLATLAAHSLMPAGFMLAPVGSEMTMVICTGHGPQTITLDVNGNPVPDKSQRSDPGLCPYASAGAVVLANAVPVPLAQQVRYAEVRYRITRDLLRSATRAGGTSARGPPLDLI